MESAQFTGPGGWRRARRAAGIVVVVAAALFAVVEVAWHLEILLKFLTG